LIIGFDPTEALFVNQVGPSSPADALSMAIGPVPAKKIWTFQAACYFPGVAETRIVWWNVVCPNGTTEIAVSVPVSIALSNTRGFPLLTPVDEFVLLPGQFLQVRRDAATAGSVMWLTALYVESDLPLYEYTEPLEKRRLRRSARDVVKALPATFGGRPSTNGGFAGSRPGDIDGGGREK
jgi:hypothetical protein